MQSAGPQERHSLGQLKSTKAPSSLKALLSTHSHGTMTYTAEAYVFLTGEGQSPTVAQTILELGNPPASTSQMPG